MSSEDEKISASKGAFQSMESADSIIKILGQNIGLNGDSICYIILAVVCDGGFSSINRLKHRGMSTNMINNILFCFYRIYLYLICTYKEKLL